MQQYLVTRPGRQMVCKDQIIAGADEHVRKKFYGRVTRSLGCWLWNGSKFQSSGYGRFSFYGITVSAHRASLIWEGGENVNGRIVAHKCRNRLCVRPDHLEWSDHKRNARDRQRDGTLPDVEGSKHPMAIIDESVARRIYEEFRTTRVCVRDLANQFGVARELINRIIGRRAWLCATWDLPAITSDDKRGRRVKESKYADVDKAKSEQIKTMLRTGKLKDSEVARIFNISPSLVSMIRSGKRWGSGKTKYLELPRVNKPRLSEKDVRKIKKDLLSANSKPRLVSRLAEKYNVSYATIYYIKQGKTFAHVEPSP